MTKKLRARLVSPLLTAIVAICVCAFSGAQEAAIDPGQNDPVGAPASYIVLRNDNLAVARYVGTKAGSVASKTPGGSIQFDTYEAELTNPDTVFGNRLKSKKVASGGSDNSVSVAGHILSQNMEHLVNVGRSAKAANAVRVRFTRGDGYTLPANLHKPLDDVPDQIAVAAGDLDKIPDPSGANHDELVVAYAQDNGQVNVAVLNYTIPAAGCPVQQKGTVTIQLKGSCPKYVTLAAAPFKVNLTSPPAPIPVNGDQNGFKLSEVLALAVGDFDGDGQNEIALATFDPVNRNSVNLAIFRYAHPTVSAVPALTLLKKTTLFALADDSNANLVPTISLAAGDFEGTGRAELVLAMRLLREAFEPEEWVFDNLVDEYSFDDKLNPTNKFFPSDYESPEIGLKPLDTLTPGRILCLPGLVNYDPSKGFNLYRRGIVVLYNDIEPVDDDAGAELNVDTFITENDPNDPFAAGIQLGDTMRLRNGGVGASFAATLGAFGVAGNINNPVWSLAVAQMRLPSLPEEPNSNLETVQVFQNINGQGFQTDPIGFDSFDSLCAISNCNSTTQNELRPTIQAYDYQGRTVLLGAPVKLTVPQLITTEFVLQDPPKHTYWDEKNQKLVVVSRTSGIAVSMTNKQGVTYTGKSTDTSASSIGGSVSETASLSVSAGVPSLFETKLNAEETAKATYNYDENKASYNSNYSSRTLTESESTVGDDFVSGRYQKLTIWRYRVLGETSEDNAGKPVNLFYDAVFPGPALDFKASGLDLDWYQPIHEPGNILSYPAPSSGTFSPLDIGTYDIPCPAGATDCNPDGTRTITGPLIPATEEFLSDTSGSIFLDYINTSGSGNQIGYQKKLGSSLDVKVGFSTKVGFFGGGDASFSESLNLNTSNSWGNTTTSDSTSTSETGITISRAAIGSPQAYSIYPTVYATLDGTIKVAFAVDPLGSSSGKSFWAGLYGALPDPALNLPLRFEQSGSSWAVNDSSSRKQMRGFFVLSQAADPVTGVNDILGVAPAAGDKVLLSAQVYNYSTAQPFTNCLVQFYAIKYDSNSDREIGSRVFIGKTTISLGPRATKPAQIIWDTKGFGPAAGSASQDYRIYVDLNYDKKINESYPPEDPNKIYAPGLAKGVDPGQNDEGFGLATVVAASPPAASSNRSGAPAVGTITSTSLAGLAPANLAGELVTSGLIASAGAPVRLRAQVCSTANSRDPVDVVVFDGKPSEGKVIAWKRVYLPGNGQCEGTWFNWTATPGDHNLVATIDPTAALPVIGNNLMTVSSLKRASLEVHVP